MFKKYYVVSSDNFRNIFWLKFNLLNWTECNQKSALTFPSYFNVKTCITSFKKLIKFKN